MNPSLQVDIGADISNLRAEMQKAQGLVSGLNQKMMDFASTIGVAFGVKEVAGFVLEVSKLAGQFDGVNNAFSKLQDSANVLNELKTATQNTVSELELMKSAVQANNFSIPIQQLGSLFEFAHQRAVATGQSVDYLVQSIVTGIGRKSPLILDNLGISAIDLRAKLKGVGTEAATVADVARAVGEIAQDSLNKAGLAAENAATKQEKLNASWQNFKVTIGQVVNDSGVIQFLLDLSNKALDGFTTTPIEKFEDAIVQFKFKARDSGDAARYTKENIGALVEMAAKAGVNFNTFVSEFKGVNDALQNLRASAAEFKGTQIGPLQASFWQPIAPVIATVRKELTALQRDLQNTKVVNKLKLDAPEIGTKSSSFKSLIPDLQPDLDKLKAYGDQLVGELGNISLRTEPIIMDLSNAVAGAFVGFGEAIGNALAGTEDLGTGLLKMLGSLMKNIGSAMIGIGTSLLALQIAIANPFTAGPALLAAGVALVALGSLISASTKSASASGGGGGGSGGASRAVDNYKDYERIRGTSFDGMQLQITGLVGNNFNAALRKSNYQTGLTGG